MQPSVYRFFINGVQVHPVYKSLIKKYEKENGQKLFREKLEGEVKIYGADYLLVKDSSIFTEHTFLMQKKNANGVYENYFTGVFNKTDCEFDFDKRECKLKVSPKDQYSKVMDNYDNEYNLADLAPALTAVTVSKRPILQVYVLEDNVINNFLPSGATWETEVDLDKGLAELSEKGHFTVESRHIEVAINTGGPYDGVYAGKGWSGAILYSANSDYIIIGSVTPGRNGYGYDYTFSIFAYNDRTIPLYTATGYSDSRFATVTFLGASSATAGVIFTAEASMETVLTRILTGGSITHDGQVTAGKIVEGDFGYIDNYPYAYSASQACSSVIVPATSKEPTSYGKADNDYYFIPPTTSSDKYYPFAKSTWAYSSRWLYLNDSFSKSFDTNGSVYRDIKDCIHIADTIKALLKKIDPDITHEATPEYSQFLYGNTNPVYGEKFDLFITQKTHIKKFIYDTPAVKVPITFKKVMDMLAKCFCCYWYIEGNKFKVEHASYFDKGKSYSSSTQTISIDITSTYNNKNGRPIGYAQNIIKYDKNSLPSRYEFGYMDESSIEFEGAAVKLIAPYLSQDKTENITPEDFSADIDMIIANTIATSDNGFALIAAKLYEDSDGYKAYSTFNYDLELISDLGHSYTVPLQNGVLSWLYLFNFYSTNLPATVAEYDGYPKKVINVTGISRSMSHEIKIPVEADPDLYQLITTSIGNGQINNISIDTTTRQATIELLYSPE